MEKYDNTIFVITGASTGLGRHAAQTLLSEIYAQNEVKKYANLPLVVGISRRKVEFSAVATKNQPDLGNFVSLQADLAKPAEIERVFDQIQKTYARKISVVLLNAGMAKAVPILNHPKLLEMCEADASYANAASAFSGMSDLNFVGLSLCLRKAVENMDHDFPGYIINLNSMSGHRVTVAPATHFYSATKHAVTAITNATRMELRAINSKIRVGQICPGFIDTEFFQAMDVKNEAYYQKIEEMVVPVALQCQDISDVLMLMVKSDARCQYGDIQIRPTQQRD